MYGLVTSEPNGEDRQWIRIGGSGVERTETGTTVSTFITEEDAEAAAAYAETRAEPRLERVEAKPIDEPYDAPGTFRLAVVGKPDGSIPKGWIRLCAEGVTRTGDRE